MTEGADMLLLGRIAATIDSLERHDYMLAFDRKTVLLNLWIEVLAIILELPEGFCQEDQRKLAAMVTDFMPTWDAERERIAKENQQ